MIKGNFLLVFSSHIMDLDWTKLSRKNGVRVIPSFSCTDEKVAQAVATSLNSPLAVKSVGRMTNSVVVFVDTVEGANQLIENGVEIDGKFVKVLPLATPSKKITLSNVPPFITDEALVQKLSCYGKVVGDIMKVNRNFNTTELKHCVSYKRTVFMNLDQRSGDFSASFKLVVDGYDYTVFASSVVKCFICGGDHLMHSCPKRRPPSHTPPSATRTWADVAAPTPLLIHQPPTTPVHLPEPEEVQAGSSEGATAVGAVEDGQVEEDVATTCPRTESRGDAKNKEKIISGDLGGGGDHQEATVGGDVGGGGDR